MAESVYKVIKLVGTSTESLDKAAAAAVERASQSLTHLRIAEVSELDMQIESGWRGTGSRVDSHDRGRPRAPALAPDRDPEASSPTPRPRPSLAERCPDRPFTGWFLLQPTLLLHPGVEAAPVGAQPCLRTTLPDGAGQVRADEGIRPGGLPVAFGTLLS